MADYHVVGTPVRKVDALSLAQGRALFTDDYPVERPLFLGFKTSQMAHGHIRSIDTSAAEHVPGVVAILDYRNVPDRYFTTAGQGFPEPSPYDTRLFDSVVRYVGDPVCVVAAESEEALRAGLAAVEVEIEPLPSLFDAERARDADAPRLHAGDEHAAIPVPYRPEENLAAEVEIGFGDVEAGFAAAAFTERHRYTTHYASHAPIEPHSTVTWIDENDRLVILSSTQVPFHVRRIVARLLDVPVKRIRVIKPRVGGGFGIKQEVILEPYAALVTLRTGRAARFVLSREEVFRSSRTRHPMRIDLTAGVDGEGRITTLEMDALMNTGAYGAHALTVLSNAGAKVLPLFNKVENLRFLGRSVYTNLPVGGAYRGYGATQGYFAFNQELDIIARRLGVDMPEYCKRWHIREGETSGVFEALGEGKEGVAQIIESCGLDECIDRGAAAIGWAEKRGKRLAGRPGTVRGVGMAIAMQGSGIPKIDMGAASMKMNEDGSFNLLVGATDLGTGSDTVLAQIAAEALGTSAEKIIVLSSDTDTTPFDVGAYASSTTYISGNAVKKCALQVLEQIRGVAAEMLGVEPEALVQEGSAFVVGAKAGATGAKAGATDAAESRVSFEDVAYYSLYAENQFQIQAGASHISGVSPPPFMAQFAEVEVDLATGQVRVLEFVNAVDCGVALNPPLAEGQMEGAALNGIAWALTEEYRFSDSGALRNASFGSFGMWNAVDIPRMTTILVETHEPTGPFGAKSVGEIGINGPAPAIANAIYDATGVRLFDLPLTSERVWRALRNAAGGNAGTEARG